MLDGAIRSTSVVTDRSRRPPMVMIDSPGPCLHRVMFGASGSSVGDEEVCCCVSDDVLPYLLVRQTDVRWHLVVPGRYAHQPCLSRYTPGSASGTTRNRSPGQWLQSD